MDDKRETLVEPMTVVRHDIEYGDGVLGVEVEGLGRTKRGHDFARGGHLGLRAASDLRNRMSLPELGQLQYTGRFQRFGQFGVW